MVDRSLSVSRGDDTAANGPRTRSVSDGRGSLLPNRVDTVNQCMYAATPMTPRSRYNFWIDDKQREGLRFVRERDGVLESEQIRRAIDKWLEEKGVTDKTDRKRAATRKRP
jgi:hypothetical protein